MTRLVKSKGFECDVGPPSGEEPVGGANFGNGAGAEVTGAAALTDVVRLRVRYSEGDQMGITYHARYLDWFAIGRTELLRTLGLPYAELERRGLFLPVLEVTCRYLGATRYDDVIQLETTLTALTRTRMGFRYEVWLLPTEPSPPGPTASSSISTAAGSSPGSLRPQPTRVTVGETSHVFVDGHQRPLDIRKRFPDVWRRLEPLVALLKSTVGDDVVSEGP